MYTNSAIRPLIDITKRARETKNILFYERDKVQEICEEIKVLKQATEEINDTESTSEEVHSPGKLCVYNSMKEKELNAIQLYHFQRIRKNKEAACRKTSLPQNEFNRLTKWEQTFYKKYEQLVDNYKSNCPKSLYFNDELHVPKEPHVVVRVMENLEGVMTKNGIVEFLKGSQAVVREADSAIAKLINSGYLKKINK
ncbi:7828_t:CDS:1 [Funneliformis geosporum]|uniref:DNA replication complex GINS protein PSF1 n=1 Tax=Funneliformis geosporum TaxID=1117311 RepID=A0A9W4SE74_9GLOM|nr:7828_t:CDS:1 [Funneliformis geosporum]CAI2166113.1 11205_t:CDS:1 [Funneliformis geosporum]